MKENPAEVIRVTCHKMSGMKEKTAEMAREMRIQTLCMKVEIKKANVEAYECLDREREKVKHEL